MSKTHEAFLKAEKQYQENLPKSFYTFQKPILTGSKIQGDQFSAHESFDNLKANLISRYAGTNVKSILFNGICHGTGCSTTTLNFANSLTVDPMRKVLLVDLKLNLPLPHRVYHHAKAPDLSGFIADGKHLMSQIEKVGPGNLYVVSCGARSLSGPVGLFEYSEFERFISSIYDNFDYLILDAPPVLIYPEFRILCSKMDGVVLVLESGNARRQVALKAKKEIEEAGGRILGVVMNRRKYYIPKWIYKRL
jgi:capsular exopolysaccharide synthesis family protein